MMQILQIPVALLDDVWPHVWPHLSRGVAVSGKSREELAADILADRTRVWVATTEAPRKVHAAWLTEIGEADGKRVVWIYGLGGKAPDAWAEPMVDAMVDYIKSEGAVAGRFAGKRGWQRYIPGSVPVGTEAGETIFERAVA